MLFSADVQQNFTLEEVNLEKQKYLSKRNFYHKVENMKQKVALILD